MNKTKNVSEILIEKVKAQIAQHGNPYEAFRGDNWNVKDWKDKKEGIKWKNQT